MYFYSCQRTACKQKIHINPEKTVNEIFRHYYIIHQAYISQPFHIICTTAKLNLQINKNQRSVNPEKHLRPINTKQGAYKQRKSH